MAPFLGRCPRCKKHANRLGDLTHRRKAEDTREALYPLSMDLYHSCSFESKPIGLCCQYRVPAIVWVLVCTHEC